MGVAQEPHLLQEDLPEVLKKEFTSYSELAVDCEMMGLNPVRDRLCLVQLAAEKGPCALIQIGKAKEAPHLKELMENENITKIFHFARMDILFLFSRLGIDVRNIYCTKIASRLARTYSERHGLRELVREFFGENLEKLYQSSDWGAEELSPEQVRYATGDVIYLFEIRRRLTTILIREGRKELYDKVVSFLPTQRELDCMGYQHIFEHTTNPLLQLKR